MLIRIIFLIILILLNGILSASEIAFLSLEKYEVDNLVKRRKKNAKKIREIINDPNNFLSAIQVGITLLGFLSSAFASTFFVNELYNYGLFIISINFTYYFLIIIITIILSYFTLVFGELVPKKIALAKPYEVAAFSTSIINFIQFIFYPVVFLLSKTTDFICRLLKIKEKENDFTEEDLKRIIITGTKDGIIAKKEQEYIFNIFKFSDTTVDKVMTPKEDCILINVNANFKQVLKILKNNKYTRYPVYNKDKNDIIGIFNVKEYIMYKKDNNDFSLKKLLFNVRSYNYNDKIDDVFASMQKEHTAMAIVKKDDEFIGIVTLEDAVEEILGNIYNEYDKED